MDLPQPPQDTDLRNIIDKLAQFVARNGPEFEQMTKSKQKGNPKFQFLYGGEFFNYYQYKVTTEQAILKSQGILPNTSGNWNTSQNNSSQNMFHSSSGQNTFSNSIPNTFQSNTGPFQSGQSNIQSNASQMLPAQNSYQQNSNISAFQQSPGSQTTFQQNSSQNAFQQNPPQTPFQQNPNQGTFQQNSGQNIYQNQSTFQPPPSAFSGQPNYQGQSNFQGNSGQFQGNGSQFQNSSGQFQQGQNFTPGVNQTVFPSTASQGPFQQNIAQSGDVDIEQINQQQEILRDQIKQSEQNLSAQHAVLMQQQQAQVESAIIKCEQEELQREANACNVNLQELYNLLQPIIDSCTKDSISSGKSWILQHAVSKSQALCVAHCLLFKVIHGSPPFSQKLHVIYLVNDVLHHCARKNANDLKDALETVVVPMFCNASIGASEDSQKTKLDKLLKLWESKANYLAPETVQKMRQPSTSYQEYQAEQMAKYSSEVGHLTQQTKATFDGYQAQHQAFICHATQQIMELEQQKQNAEANTNSGFNQSSSQDINGIQQQNISLDISFNQQQGINPPNPNAPIPQNEDFSSMPPLNLPPPHLPPNGGIEMGQFSQPPPGFFPPPGSLFPDFSKPPPGFPLPQEPQPEELMPSVPYYDLPAGLIVPLIKLEDTSFKPLDPKAIRLPPPAPPSERLLAAVEAFYSPPSHDRPRDSEGWEKLGLYEYYKAKNNAKREKEEKIAAGLREKSRSPSPVVVIMEKSPSPPKRRYMSRSPSPPLREKRSRSRSPRRRRSSRSSKRRRSDSRSRSRSRTPPPFNRSPSPPPPSFGSFHRQDIQEIDATNKGHQMLSKMGWSGRGLGIHEQGIDAPISGGDVRDRQDQFKGVGCNLNDPYENFRKNKGAAFITRMKARAEERANENKVYD